jgi:HJR/Mrr/RecB family endonuclease
MGKKKSQNNGCAYIVLIVIFIAALPYIYPFLIILGVIALVVGIVFAIGFYFKRKQGRDLVIQQQEDYAEYQRRLQEKKALFFKSPDYNFVEQFSKKYQNRASDEDIDKLGILLQKGQWYFSPEELKTILLQEDYRQESANIKNRILAMKPNGFDGFLRSYIEICGNDYNKLNLLGELLQSTNTYQNPSFDVLQQELYRINKQIELELFEKRLLGEDNKLTLEDIDGLSGYDFESFLKELFSKMGYQVEQTKLSGDQGADVVVVKFGEKTVIQAKRFNNSVGNKAVQEIMAAISFYKAQKGMVVTNNYFTKPALELAEANNIGMINREGLKELIEKYW